jgi:hypothetical protein
MSQSNANVTLETGREVVLQSLEQQSVEAGRLEGLPTRQSNEAFIKYTTAEARARDRHPPFLIPPEQRSIPHFVNYAFGEPATLPAICCIGRFVSDKTGRIATADYSSLTIIWFQDDYAFPISNEAMQAIRAIDWDSAALDQEH